MADNKFERKDLDELVKEVMGISSITPTINRQIQTYIIKDKMTYKEVARCIVYYNEIMHMKVEPVYGLYFVPAVRDRAAAHFKQLELDQQRQQEEVKKVVEYQENNIIFNIKSLKHKKRQPKQINIEDIDIKGDDN